MMRKIFTTLSVLALICALAVNAMAQSYSITATIDAPESVVLTGESVTIPITVTIVRNDSHSGNIPQFYVTPVVTGGTVTPNYSPIGLAPGASATYEFLWTITDFGDFSLSFDWGSRNQNLKYEWNGSVTVSVVEPEPEVPGLPPGFGTDKDGNLIIQGLVLPQTNGQEWMIVIINEKDISGHGEYNTNSKSIKIKNKVLESGTVFIAGTLLNGKCFILMFELTMQDGFPFSVTDVDYIEW